VLIRVKYVLMLQGTGVRLEDVDHVLLYREGTCMIGVDGPPFDHLLLYREGTCMIGVDGPPFESGDRVVHETGFVQGVGMNGNLRVLIRV